MIPASYWKHLDTPMKNSPTGKAMLRIHELYPELTVFQCLERAREALAQAAARKHYSIKILSPEQAEKARKRTMVWVERKRSEQKAAPLNAKEGHSSEHPRG